MNTEKIIIFIHIPKTAGNTFRNIIIKQYNTSEIINLYTDKPDYYVNFDLSLIQIILKEKIIKQDKYKIIIGHYKFGLHDLIKTKKTGYIAFLRNPQEQYISMYNHLISDSRFWNISENNLKEISEFIDFKITHNMQTFLISGISDFNIMDNNPDYVLQEAIKNIDTHFLFTGLTEYFNESLIVLKYKLKIKNPYYYKHNVRNSKKKIVTDEKLKLIQEKILLDNQLYAYAKEKLFDEIKQIPFFKYRLIVFKMMNQFYILLHKIITLFSGKKKK